jgi:hypothetical protein
MSVRTMFAVSCSIVVCVLFAPSGAAKVDRAGGNCAAAQRTLAAHSRATALRTFDDFIEDTNGPDICGQNAITNDNEGTVTAGMHIHNRSGFAANEAYGIFLDTDLNPATGGAGAEYRVRLTSEATILGKWDGTRFAPQATLEPATWASGYGPVFTFKIADVGDVKGFNFIFFTTDGVIGDLAPNRGSWSYQLTPLELTVRAMALDRARAGRSFSARMAVVRSDFDLPLGEGAIACSAKIGAKAMAGSGRFAGGRVVCTWRLPRSARGKRLSGTVAVTFQGVEAKRSFATRVR